MTDVEHVPVWFTRDELALMQQMLTGSVLTLMRQDKDDPRAHTITALVVRMQLAKDTPRKTEPRH